MLIASPRHSTEDLKRWSYWTSVWEQHAQLRTFAKHIDRSEAALLSFTGAHPCYCGVSWGKDSVVVAELVQRLVPRVPLVWVRVDPDHNPDCLLVRDEFLRRYPSCRYDEIPVRRAAGAYRAHGTLEQGTRLAAQRYGARYVSGVRAEESGARKHRMTAHGESTASTCAPIGWWSGDDVFAYLLQRGLPIHPAYACLLDGHLDPRRVRVSPLGGDRGQRTGDGFGRSEWEERYYRDEVAALAARA